MKTPEIIVDLEQIVHPLVEHLNRLYRTGKDEEYLIPRPGRFGDFDSELDAQLIELPDDLNQDEHAMRLLATMLFKSGSETIWSSHRDDTENPYGFPLRISLVKRAAWAGHWKWTRDLLIQNVSVDLDVDAARRQIARLVDHLENPANLIALDAEVRGLF